jgi:hypothetical protein
MFFTLTWFTLRTKTDSGWVRSHIAKSKMRSKLEESLRMDLGHSSSFGSWLCKGAREGYPPQQFLVERDVYHYGCMLYIYFCTSLKVYHAKVKIYVRKIHCVLRSIQFSLFMIFSFAWEWDGVEVSVPLVWALGQLVTTTVVVVVVVAVVAFIKCLVYAGHFF